MRIDGYAKTPFRDKVSSPPKSSSSRDDAIKRKGKDSPVCILQEKISSCNLFWIPCRHREIKYEKEPDKTPSYEWTDIRNPEIRVENTKDIRQEK